MNYNYTLDLFKQFPISRLKIKRICKNSIATPTQIIEELLKEQICHKLNRKYFFPNHLVHGRRLFLGTVEERVKGVIDEYSQLCQNTKEFSRKIRQLKLVCMAQYEPIASYESRKSLKKISYDLSLNATQVIYIAISKKKLTSADVHKIRKCTMALKHIPWEYATKAALQEGIRLGIYKEKEIPNFFGYS